jgi:pyroglutamyl-peptidase
MILFWSMALLSALSVEAVERGPASGNEPVVMITAFEPFGGRSTNGSEVLARHLAQRYQRQGVRYEICVLPVEFERAAEKARECYRRLPRKPAMVISTGESGRCEIQIETRARNRRNELDSQGRSSGTVVPIVPGGPRFERFTYPLAPMYCSGLSRRNVRVSRHFSSDTGKIQCNETSYRLNSFFREENVPYGFIHVPGDGARCGRNFRGSFRDHYGGQLHRMVRGALDSLRPAKGPSPSASVMEAAQRCRDSEGAPVIESQEFLSQVTTALTRNCEREVAQYLSEELENDSSDRDLWSREFEAPEEVLDDSDSMETEEGAEASGVPLPPKRTNSPPSMPRLTPHSP